MSIPGWRLTGKTVDLFVTTAGAQLAPASFRLESGKTVEPFYMSPWQYVPQSEIAEPVLRPMRGDFFCLPFGGGKGHPGHGEAAGSDWTLVKETANSLTLELKTRAVPGTIRRTIAVRDNDSAIYLRHELIGYTGSMPLGSHPILPMPEEGEKMFLCSSPFALGLTRPGIFSDPSKREYQRLAPGELFTDLRKLPLNTREPAHQDYSTFPTPCGFVDLFCLMKRPGADPAWMAAVYPERGYLWFALKDAAQLPATALWCANSGRYAPPWNGDVRCFGVEEVCAAFDLGLEASLEENLMTRAGFPTALKLDGGVEVRLIEGVAALPDGFGRVAEALFAADSVTFIDENGLRAVARVRAGFIRGENV